MKKKKKDKMKKKAAVRDWEQETNFFHLIDNCKGEAGGRCWQEISGIMCGVSPSLEQWWELHNKNWASHLHSPSLCQGSQGVLVHLPLAEKSDILIQKFYGNGIHTTMLFVQRCWCTCVYLFSYLPFLPSLPRAHCAILAEFHWHDWHKWKVFIK